ncbi:hypothetical protein FWH13_00190 [Candidatus Saccharibacteria bacterium]|nr:hypothetical protein [Candidatus Saccharibacteria bacterium]
MDTNSNSADSSAMPAAAGTDINSQPPTSDPFPAADPVTGAPSAPTPAAEPAAPVADLATPTASDFSTTPPDLTAPADFPAAPVSDPIAPAAPNPFAQAAEAEPATPTSTPFGVSQDTLAAQNNGTKLKLGGQKNILTIALVGIVGIALGVALGFFLFNSSSNTSGGNDTVELTTLQKLETTLDLPESEPTLTIVDATNLAEQRMLLPLVELGDQIFTFPATSDHPQSIAVWRPDIDLVVVFVPIFTADEQPQPEAPQPEAGF